MSLQAIPILLPATLFGNNGGAGVSVDGNTNVDGYLITKNSFAGNTLNAIDLHRGYDRTRSVIK